MGTFIEECGGPGVDLSGRRCLSWRGTVGTKHLPAGYLSSGHGPLTLLHVPRLLSSSRLDPVARVEPLTGDTRVGRCVSRAGKLVLSRKPVQRRRTGRPQATVAHFFQPHLGDRLSILDAFSTPRTTRTDCARRDDGRAAIRASEVPCLCTTHIRTGTAHTDGLERIQA